MATKTLRGQVETGCGDARSWDISEIRRVTGFDDLKESTLNVRLDAAHNLRPDYTLLRGDRECGRDEDLYFERCCLVIGPYRVSALIARTSRDFWGPSVLEIMAEELLRQRYRLQDGDALEVEVWVESRGGLSDSTTA